MAIIPVLLISAVLFGSGYNAGAQIENKEDILEAKTSYHTPKVYQKNYNLN